MKTVVFDFDGVIHSYTSGWQGAAVVPDPPVAGIKEAIDALRGVGYQIAVVSSRAVSSEGYKAIKEFLEEHEINVDQIACEKPPAMVYIDDRAICFDGNAASLTEKVINFRTWLEKGTVHE